MARIVVIDELLRWGVELAKDLVEIGSLVSG
jgi:hypothetical protein